MRRRNSNWWVWLILFFVFSGGMSFMLPLFLIIAVVVGIAIASVSTYKNNSSDIKEVAAVNPVKSQKSIYI